MKERKRLIVWPWKSKKAEKEEKKKEGKEITGRLSGVRK